jgi:hypothetical protein
MLPFHIVTQESTQFPFTGITPVFLATAFCTDLKLITVSQKREEMKDQKRCTIGGMNRVAG